MDQVPLSKTIKDLVGGKSALQNEILGDLQLEFTSAPEKAEEWPLEELASVLGVGFAGTLGKYSNSLASRLMRYLKRDSRSGEIAFDRKKANSLALQARLDSIAKEHGDTHIDGIQPIFDPLKARRFDSSWNWARQDALLMYYDVIFGRLATLS